MGKQKPHHCLRNLQNLALMSLTRKLEADSWVAEKSAAYRKIKQLETELERAKRQARKYKKWLQKMNTSAAPDTPRTKTRKLLADFYRCKQSVKKLLVFHYALLVQQIRNRYQESTVERQKRTFADNSFTQTLNRHMLQHILSNKFIHN